MIIAHLPSFFKVFPQVLTEVFLGLNGEGTRDFSQGTTANA